MHNMMIADSHPFLVLSQEMIELCKPLEAFKIHHVTYLKQLKSGHRITLSNKPNWIADYYNLMLYQSSLFEDPFQHPKHSFDTWFGDYDLDVYRHGKLYYNTMHAISIVDYGADGSESFLFSTAPEHPSAIHFLSNHREILYHFILYFKDHGRFMLKKAEKNKIFLAKEPIINDIEEKKWFQNPEWINEMFKQKEKFFLKTPLHHATFYDSDYGEVKFTQRELMCIHYLLQYKTATEIAFFLNLSKRTVESYIEHIRLKLNCTSKSELIEKIKKIPYCSALTLK